MPDVSNSPCREHPSASVSYLRPIFNELDSTCLIPQTDVVFPCVWTLDKTGGEIRLNYGGADTCMVLATARHSDLLTHLGTCPAPQTVNRRTLTLSD